MLQLQLVEGASENGEGSLALRAQEPGELKPALDQTFLQMHAEKSSAIERRPKPLVLRPV
jgi:hypothetical protein